VKKIKFELLSAFFYILIFHFRKNPDLYGELAKGQSPKVRHVIRFGVIIKLSFLNCLLDYLEGHILIL
jgi:hypothetical protein